MRPCPIVNVMVTMRVSVLISLCIIFCFLSNFSVHAGLFTKRGVIISGFRFEDCSNGKNVIKVRDFSIGSNEDGDLVVSGAAETSLNITSPIKGKMSLSRSILGIKIPVPCIMNFGTCKYPDLCSFGIPPKETCPPILEENDVPCRCPIPMGDYELPSALFSMGTTRLAGLLSGSYSGSITITMSDTFMACYKFVFKLI